MYTASSIADGPNPQSTSSPAELAHTPESFRFIVTHVFFPVILPYKDDCTPENNHSLARAVCAAAHAYHSHVRGTFELPQWDCITKMLDSLQALVQSEKLDSHRVISQLQEMQTGDTLTFFIRRQNAAVVLTKGVSFMLCDAFEVSPSKDVVNEMEGHLVCSYPGSSIEIPNEVFGDRDVQFEFTNLLCCTNVDSDLTFPPPSHPQYISVLFDSIVQNAGHAVAVSRVTKHSAPLDSVLCGGHTSDVSRITKHVRDEVQDNWRRSSVWLLIRVAIQMSVDRASYKRFMLFFICTISMNGSNLNLSSDLLHLMSSKILRRLSKLDLPPLDWLSEMALKIYSCLREILDVRWKQLSVRPSLFRNPSCDELVRDTQLSLLNSREYIYNALTNTSYESPRTPFHPSRRHRGTIEDFLSSNGSFFDEACNADPDITLYDVERSVEQGIDDWLACVTSVEEACTQLEILMDQYMKKKITENAEDTSTMLLTGIELYVALDKLVVKEIPMLADYPPEIPITWLHKLLLRKRTSLHRLACAYQYLSVRHSRSRPGWSVLSNDFTEDSFPVRYFNQFPHFQQLKARIGQDATTNVVGEAGLQPRSGGPTWNQAEYHYRLPGRPVTKGIETSFSPLPALPTHAKVVVFELQCPPCIRIWRDAAPRILNHVGHMFTSDLVRRKDYDLLERIPALQPYFIEPQRPPVALQIHLAYLYPDGSQSGDSTTLCYGVYNTHGGDWQATLSIWQPRMRDEDPGLLQFGHEFGSSPELTTFVDSTSHTSNNILAAQADCPQDFTLDEYIAFAHLRGGGSLQWLNILQGLRSRTLNLRYQEIHFLLAHSAFQVGPLDINTGTWIWHQELEDSSFCNALLDELESLFIDVGAGSIDDVLMNTISLLLTRMLASSPSEDVSARAIALLRRIRRKTFGWVQELSYDLSRAPTNRERKDLLRDMAITCRSTFDVDTAILCKLFHSTEDVDAILSCAFFIYALPLTFGLRSDYPRYSLLLLTRDRRLFLALDETLKDVILTDPTDYGVDLAVQKIVTFYQPCTHRWEQLQLPNNAWLTCEAEATAGKASQTVHFNLLNGELRIDGQLLGCLPAEILGSPTYQEIFRDQGFFVVPSNLLGVDFTTTPMSVEHKVHFSVRDNILVIRAQRDHTHETLELIPSKKFRTDLPPALVDGHVHWLNLSTKTIEIRPLEQAWEESSDHWRIQIDCVLGQHRMYKGSETLVDVWSPTWTMLSKCFECLNHPHDEFERQLIRSWHDDDDDIENWPLDLLITASFADSASMLRLSVTLPYYSLSFFVNGMEELESSDFKGMVYAENQSVGTLFGLESILVLQQRTHLAGCLIPDALILQRVIVPIGIPRTHSDRQIRIDLDSRHGPLYHTYIVNTELGCLMGGGSVTGSMEFLSSLHAITSCHRPDPLTGKTGTQAALDLVQSAGCRSIMIPGTLANDIQWYARDFRAVFRNIQNRYNWNHDLRHDPEFHVRRDKRAAQRAVHLFPANATGSTPSQVPNWHDENSYLATRIPTETGHSESPMQITLDHLFCNRPAPELPGRHTLLRDSYTTSLYDVTSLDELFSTLRGDSSLQREYLTHLHASAEHVREQPRIGYRVANENHIGALKEHFLRCSVNYQDSLNILKKCLGPTADPQEQKVSLFGHWPPITADVLLRYLASTTPVEIPARWKKCLTSLALLLLDLQRARRLLQLALAGPEEDFLKELENEGCDGWDPEKYPDWLLIQIQGNFLIRRTQVETAMELMFPLSEENTVMQVNMGEGKSSVIIPISAAALADGRQLVRVVVPKALTIQMFELLVSRLGGLANRPIYHLPFSRSSNHEDALQIDDLDKLMSRCMAEHGVVLVQPEHIVSLRLMAVEEQIGEGNLMTDISAKHPRSIYEYVVKALSLKSLPENSLVGSLLRSLKQSPDRSSKKDTDHHSGCSGSAQDASNSASKWLRFQKWLHSHARDILDESDEILHARFQLVYTVGMEQHMDGYPDRWTITQQVLRRVKKHIYSLSRYSRDCIEYECGPPGSFPRVRILRPSDVGRQLTSLITEDVIAGRLPSFNFQHVSAALHNAIRSFISDEDVLQIPDTVKRVEQYAKGPNQSRLWSGVLLLRGLLTSNILLFALAERRWRVDYGLAEGSTTPTMLAVPYRAKDVPAPNTQFGHPDLTIILTCLSYYYAGLSKQQLRRSFEILQDQDNPITEYTLWMKEYDRGTVPDSLQELRDINLRSSEQWDDVIFPLFARNQAAIDFYLSRVVFPKEAKEFPWKLSGSSWDLAEKREKLTTGFSGTSDGRWLLPMSIVQRDPDHQQGANTKVLAYLLQPENDFYMVTHRSKEPWTTLALLRIVATQQPEIRVLLDVGSQILDYSNHQVATAWLKISQDTAGAVYFNEHDELTVLTRNGTTTPMSSSPLSQQLERCVVYLDHVHTRGTDIKLAVRSRAAVTLGPRVTKDALVQGCTRMRKLGHGHSVMFFAPPEVDRNIRALADKTDPTAQVTTVDILRWSIHETWIDIQRRAPYWAQQGMNHKRRYDAWSRFVDEKITREKLADAWRQPELKSLENLYAPCKTEDNSTQGDLSVLDSDIQQRCKDLGILSLPSAQMEEEQEREVNRERERERDVELPPKAEPVEHFLHPDVVSFVKAGIIPRSRSSRAFVPVFTTLEKSSATTREANIWSPFILATADFCNTIKPESTRGSIDQYLRPVQWILSSKKNRDRVLVLLSPFEADRLMPDIRASESVHLHVYAPRTSERMRPSDDLRLYSIPPLPSDWNPPWDLIDQLNVFAGQLYFRDYASYVRLCRFLGVPCTKESRDSTLVPQQNSSDIRSGTKTKEVTFASSPLPFVKALLAIRTRGRPFEQTHMGKILQGQFLTEKDFQR